MKPSLIIKHFDLLVSRRQTWESPWSKIADYVLPRKNDIYMNRDMRGDIKNTLYDATAPHSNELLASSLHSMLSNPSLPFMEMSTGNEKLDNTDEVRAWLQEVQRIIHSTLSNSNFHTEVHEVYLDLGSFGTTILRIEEDESLHVRFECKPIFEGYIAENSKGVIDTVYRKFSWTLRQVVQEWGIKSLSDALLKMYNDNPLEEIDLLHCVMPREETQKKGKDANKPWYSVYIARHTEHVLNEGGFHEFPYAIPRWTKTSGEIYGRSPAYKALPDIMMMNQMKKTTLRSAQKVVDPPMQAPDDGISLPIKSNPNALNYYRRGTKDRIEPILTGGRIDFGYQAMADIRQSIKEAFFVDRLQLAKSDRMTTVEVRQRIEEDARVFSPLLGRLHTELLSPTITRVFGILTRKGLLPAVPPSLDGEFIQVRYSSMVAKAQKTAKGQNLMRALQDVGPLLEMNPQMIDNIDMDEAIREALKLHGVSEEVIKSTAKVKQDRQAQAQQMAKQQKMDEQSQQADTDVKRSQAQEV